MRYPIQVRAEIAADDERFMTRTRTLGLEGMSMLAGERVPAGSTLNVLLYIPHGEEVELLRVQGEAIACREKHGLYDIISSFRRFAPGDERRLRDWLGEWLAARRPTQH